MTARADRLYLDATHRGRGHRADGAGEQSSEPTHSELERLVRAELTEASKLDTSAGRVLVLAARRVEASDGASDAMRQYWAARADAGLSAAPAPTPAPVEPTSDDEGGDDGDSLARLVNGGSSLTLVAG